MFFIWLIRYFRGYVSFAVNGVYLEAFMNICAKQQVYLWDVRRQEDVLHAKVKAHDYKKLRPFCKKTGVTTKLSSKHGIPFLLHRYSKRVGILAGVIIFFAFLAFMSGYVWEIEVEGNDRLSTNVVLSTLEECGFEKGKLKSSMNLQIIEEKMMIKLPDLAWIAINLNGSRAVIEIKERLMPPTITDQAKPANVIARKTGQIVKMEVYLGKPVLKKGDTVMKGELIVAGVYEDKKANTRIKRARAMVIARTVEFKEIKVSLKGVETSYTGNKKTLHSITIFGNNIPLYWGNNKIPYKNYEEQRQSTPVKIFGISFPFTLQKNIYSEYTQKDILIDVETAKKKALAEVETFEKGELREAKIIDKKIIGELKKEEYVVQIEYQLEEEIGIQQEIEIIN